MIASMSDLCHEPRLRRIFGLGNPSAGKAGLQQLAIRPEERMGPVELPDRDLMGDQAAKTFAGKPDVQVKGRRFDLKRRLAQFGQVEVNCMPKLRKA